MLCVSPRGRGWDSKRHNLEAKNNPPLKTQCMSGGSPGCAAGSNALSPSRYKRCDQIEERKARRLSGKIVPKGDFLSDASRPPHPSCHDDHPVAPPALSLKLSPSPSLSLSVSLSLSLPLPLSLPGPSKRRRASLSAGHSSNEEGEEGSPGRLPGDGQSLSVRKQPKRVVKPRIYFDLLDYDSDLDLKAPPSATSPARRRGHGPRFNQGS